MSDNPQIVVVPKDLYYHEVAYVRGLEKRVEALEAALRIFADNENWRYGRRLDPNGSRFDGINVAETALAPEQTK